MENLVPHFLADVMKYVPVDLSIKNNKGLAPLEGHKLESQAIHKQLTVYARTQTTPLKLKIFESLDTFK